MLQVERGHFFSTRPYTRKPALQSGDPSENETEYTASQEIRPGIGGISAFLSKRFHGIWITALIGHNSEERAIK
jgi:hypothetical protein